MKDEKEYFRRYYQTVAKPRLCKRYEKPCIICGKLIHTKGALKCGSCAQKGRIGKYGAHWQGGRIMRSGGYVSILKPDHPRADKHGYVREHILIWEQVNGRPLPDGWVVHHLNGITDDNRPINLIALPNKKHKQVLAAKAKRIQELEALLNHQSQLL